MKACYRRKLKRAISYHEQKRRNIIYARGTPGEAITWTTFVEDHDDLWLQAAAEYRCAERIKKLLNKYQ